MRLTLLLAFGWFLIGMVSAPEATAQQTRRPAATRGKYHGTASTAKRRVRSGAYARYDRSNRRDEENLKLAPGLRLGMPNPPTTDYMGRPLKKKAPPKPASNSTTMSSGTPAAVPKQAAAPRKRR